MQQPGQFLLGLVAVRNPVSGFCLSLSSLGHEQLRRSAPGQLDKFDLSLGTFQNAVIETTVPKLVGDFQNNVSESGGLNPFHDVHHSGAHRLFVFEDLILT